MLRFIIDYFVFRNQTVFQQIYSILQATTYISQILIKHGFSKQCKTTLEKLNFQYIMLTILIFNVNLYKIQYIKKAKISKREI